jgi:histidine ammonia-lyase
MGFLAWRRADAIGHCLDAALAILAALGAQALHAADRPPTPALAQLVDEVRAVFPPVEAVRPSAPTATPSPAPSRSASSGDR